MKAYNHEVVILVLQCFSFYHECLAAVKSLIGQSTVYLLPTFLSLSPAAEGEPHPEQLLPADVVLFLPETGWCVSGERSLADPQSSHCPTNSTWAGQVGLYVWLYSQDSPARQTEFRSHYWPGEPLPTGPIWIHTGKNQSCLYIFFCFCDII